MSKKKSWSWDCDECLLDLLTVMRKIEGDEAIAKALSKTYEPELSRNKVSAGFNRKSVVERLQDLAPDANALLAARSARASQTRKSARLTQAWKKGAKKASREKSPHRKIVSEAPPEPRRQASPHEIEQTKTINSYFDELRKRDIRRGV